MCATAAPTSGSALYRSEASTDWLRACSHTCRSERQAGRQAGRQAARWSGAQGRGGQGWWWLARGPTLQCLFFPSALACSGWCLVQCMCEALLPYLAGGAPREDLHIGQPRHIPGAGRWGGGGRAGRWVRKAGLKEKAASYRQLAVGQAATPAAWHHTPAASSCSRLQPGVAASGPCHRAR